MDWQVAVALDIFLALLIIGNVLYQRLAWTDLARRIIGLEDKLDNGINEKIAANSIAITAQMARCDAYCASHAAGGSHDVNVSTSTGSGHAAGEGHIGTSQGQRTEIK